jgi:outer membrane protein OmpA-like peptidoglycan-associated protein
MNRIGWIILVLLALPAAGIADIRIFGLPGADIYGNQTGGAFLVGAEADLASMTGESFLNNTWIGVAGGAAEVSNGTFSLNQMDIGLSLDWQYRKVLGTPLFGGVSLFAAPAIADRVSTSGSSGNMVGMLLLPRLSAGVDLGDSFQVSLTAGPKFEVFSTFYLTSLYAGIEVAWLIKPSARHDAVPATIVITNQQIVVTNQAFSTQLESILQSNQITATVSKQQNETRLEMSDILFEKGKAEVNTNFARVITTIASTLRSYSNLYVLVEGHSDNVGDEKFNRELSEKRAQAVAEIFLSSGMPYSKVFSKGYGGTQPIASNDDEAGRSRNRRVEIRFIESQR